jgi:hypothetical protein
LFRGIGFENKKKNTRKMSKGSKDWPDIFFFFVVVVWLLQAIVSPVSRRTLEKKKKMLCP